MLFIFEILKDKNVMKSLIDNSDFLFSLKHPNILTSIYKYEYKRDHTAVVVFITESCNVNFELIH
jgi:hypothetical protein